MGDDDFSWLMDDGALSGGDSGIDPTLLPLIQQTPDYTPMLPFNPQDPNFSVDPTFNVGGSSGGGSSNSGLSALMSALGLKQMGSGGLGQILAAALGIGGGLFNRTNTQHATDAALSRLTDTSNNITGILQNNNTLYRPYADMGNSAAAALQAMQGPQNIAGNFQPLGTGRGITLGQLAGH